MTNKHESLSLFSNYDWACALIEAELGSYQWSQHEKAVEKILSDLKVEKVLFSAEGENDGADWLAVLELADGSLALLRAGCDYTGWDCQAGGSITAAPTLSELCRMCMDATDRDRLGLDVFGEVVR